MPNKYKNDLSIEVLVGFFMFIILIALGVFTIVLSRQNFLKDHYPIEVVFDEVGGLREGDNVFLRGTQVGVVKAMLLRDNHVEVVAQLDMPVQFREGYKVEVVASSMLGGKIMKIYEGPLAATPISPDTVIAGATPIDILEELGSAIATVKGMTEDLAGGKGTLGKLMVDDAVYNDFKEMMDNLNGVSSKLAKGEGTIGKLLQDDSVFKNLDSTVANLSEVSERLVNGEGTLGKLLSKDDQLYTDIRQSASNIRKITDKIEAGGGTLGRLVEDDEIYVEAQKLLEELRAAIDDMRETSPVTTFGSVLFGAM